MEKIIKNLQSDNHQKVEEAFNIIYQKYNLLVYYVSLKILHDKDLALETTNETFYQFFKNRFHIDNNKNLKYYLVTTCHNLSLNTLKKINKTIELQDIYAYQLEIDHFQDYLKEFQEFLDENELEILIFHFLYDFTFKEIALKSNVSVNVITGKYQRALKKIKKYYQK